MIYIEAPTPYHKAIHGQHQKKLFLAGGITSCPPWGEMVVDLLKNEDAMLFNPRRKNFDTRDPSATEAQIMWERAHLIEANAILFWFPKETLCPITLLELGCWLAGGGYTHKPLFIGTHPEYQKREDVVIQTSLIRKDVSKIHDSLESLVSEVKGWISRPIVAFR